MEPKEAGKVGLTRTHLVQRTGRSSLSVTLPKSWTRLLNIQAGDAVTVRQRGDGTLELNFSGPRKAEGRMLREVTIEAAGAPPSMISRLLVGAYISGQDRILVTHPSPECRRNMTQLDQVVKHLVGTSLVGESGDKIEFEVFVDPSKYEHSTLHNRLSRMLHMEIEILRQSLATGDAGPLAQIASIEDEIDRFYYLIVRQVHLASDDYQLAHLSGMTNHTVQFGCRLVAKMLEVLGDLLSEVGADLRAALSSDHPPSMEVRRGLSQVLGRLEQLLESTTKNMTEPKARTSGETLEGILTATGELSLAQDRWLRGTHDKEVVTLVNGVMLRLVMGFESLKVVNETLINRAISPESVANSGFEPIAAGTPPEP